MPKLRLTHPPLGRAIASLAAVALLVLGGCAPSPNQADTSTSVSSASLPRGDAGTTSAESELTIPSEGLPEWVQCFVDHGYVLVDIEPPDVSGYSSVGYVFESTLTEAQEKTADEACKPLEPPPPPPPSREDLKVIYDRWVDERACLQELGYRPKLPASFETFVSGWFTGEVWTPLDGVDTATWDGPAYSQAKEKCVLEFFGRD